MVPDRAEHVKENGRPDSSDNGGREDLKDGTVPKRANGEWEQMGDGKSRPQIHATSEAAN
jgi:hypothetical protein